MIVQHTSNDSGAVLVETLIAAAIMAMMTGALFSLTAAQTKRSHTLQNQQTAMMIAQSRLAQIGSLIPRDFGRTTGVEGDYNWTVDLTRYNQSLSNSQAGQLAYVKIVVGKYGTTQTLAQLETLQLVPAR